MPATRGRGRGRGRGRAKAAEEPAEAAAAATAEPAGAEAAGAEAAAVESAYAAAGGEEQAAGLPQALVDHVSTAVAWFVSFAMLWFFLSCILRQMMLRGGSFDSRATQPKPPGFVS